MPGSPEATLEHEVNQSKIPASTDDVRLARKVNKLVDEKLISPEQASEATGTEIDRMVDELFTPRFHQNYYKPEQIEPLKPGQSAELVVVELLKSLPGVHVEHASDELDQGIQKADIVLRFDGNDTPIYVQITALSDERLMNTKRAKLPQNTILVKLSSEVYTQTAGIVRAGLDIGRRVRHEVMTQVLLGLKQTPAYQGVFGTLQERLPRKFR